MLGESWQQPTFRKWKCAITKSLGFNCTISCYYDYGLGLPVISMFYKPKSVYQILYLIII